MDASDCEVSATRLSHTALACSLSSLLSHNVCRVLLFRFTLLDWYNRPPKGSTRKKASAAPSIEGTATPQIPVRAI
jgi:hypothetical protein